MHKKYKISIVIGAVLLSLVLCACENEPALEKDANPLFEVTNLPEIIPTEDTEPVEVAVIPPKNIINIKNKDKIDVIASKYPDFYSGLKKTLNNYEQGNLLSFINVFLNSSIKDDYLFNEVLDKIIISNTRIEFISAFESENKLILETKITYYPVLLNALYLQETVEPTYAGYRDFCNIRAQSEYFTFTFDMLKYSKSEGVKIKDYKYKDYAIRALTSTMYDSKKYILEYSEENKQDVFDAIVRDLRNHEYDKQEWMTQDIIDNLTENQIFFDTMLRNTSIKSINNEYYIISYPDIKNCVPCTNYSVEDLIQKLDNNEIQKISKIVHDENLDKFYNFIKNLMIT